jgi:hypothetical protein
MNTLVAGYRGILVMGRKITIEPNDQGRFGVVMPCCGRRYVFSTATLPLKDMPCPCKRENFYIVKYED